MGECVWLMQKRSGDQGHVWVRGAKGVELLTPRKQEHENRLVPLSDKWLLRHRAIIETINDQLKNISQIEHSLRPSLAACAEDHTF